MKQTRCFQDEDGRTWKVTKDGSNYSVANIKPGEKRIDVARNCARRLGVTQVKYKDLHVPIEHLNQHIMIWKEIWPRGNPC